MIDIESIWTEVIQRAPPERAHACGSLREFLAKHESPHAQALSGREITDKLGRVSGEMLESSVIARINEVRSFTKHAAAEWLRLLYDAQRAYLAAGGNVDYFTRLALLQKPESSPFSPPLQAKARLVMVWRQALNDWLAGLVERELTSPEWQAGMVLSAVIHGGLCDKGKVATFASSLSQPFLVVRQRPYVEFHQKFEGLGDFHCQRWFVDPVTELLGYRRPPFEGLSKIALSKAIQQLLIAQNIPKASCPRGLADLVDAASTKWFGQSSRVDVEIMRRGIIAHGFHERTWARLFGAPEADKSPTQTDFQDYSPESEIDWRADIELLFPWWFSIRSAMPAGKFAVSAVIDKISCQAQVPSEMGTYLQWIQYLLDGHNATRKKLAEMTIFSYVTAAIPQLLSLLGPTDPATLDVEALSDFYEEAIGACPPDVPSRILAKALREFHAFLSKRFKIAPLESIREVLGEDAGLEPVDANVLTVDQYFAARDFLDQLTLHGRDLDDVKVAKLVMTLAFRGGLRRMEIFGLRLIDVSSIKHLELLVQEHMGRRLKTKASRRVVPIRFLMTTEERSELRQWINRRESEERNLSCSDYLFALPIRGKTQVSPEIVSDRIIEALCYATKRPKTKIHQLRHSFGSWLYLALRAPDYPGIESFLEGSPRTKQFIAQGGRLRKILGIGSEITSRTYAYAVARLLGHSSPLVSLGHYIHTSEFLHYHLALNQAKSVPRESLLGVGKLKPQWGARLLTPGINFYLEHVRRQHRKSNAAASDLSPDRQPLPKKAAGRKRVTAPSRWLPLRSVHGFLHQCATSSLSTSEIASATGIPAAQAEALILAAQGLVTMLRLPAIGSSQLPDLPFPRTVAELAWETNIESRLKRAFALSPQTTKAGVMTHLRQFTLPKGDVVFRGNKEREAFDIYTEFLQLLDLRDHRIEVVLRSYDDPEVPGWARRRLKIFGCYTIRRVNPAVANDTKSYASWIGLHIKDKHSARPLLTRSLMLLAAIASSSLLAMEPFPAG